MNLNYILYLLKDKGLGISDLKTGVSYTNSHSYAINPAIFPKKRVYRDNLTGEYRPYFT